MPSATTDAAAQATTEAELRSRLAEVLEQARTCLLSYGALDPGAGSVAKPASATTLLDLLGTLLADAIHPHGGTAGGAVQGRVAAAKGPQEARQGRSRDLHGRPRAGSACFRSSYTPN